MERHQLQNAREKVQGYCIPRPHESALGKDKEVFDRAKSECLQHLRNQIQAIETLTFDQFANPKKYVG